jgi:hypothetical protein
MSFHRGYRQFCSGRRVSKELRPLLAAVYNQVHTSPVNLTVLRDTLIRLMSFLCEPQNRTDANCTAVDMFFAIEDHWDKRWDRLPEEYRMLLDDIGGALHDTVSAPDIAENFDSTPEQLLERAKNLRT